MVSPDGTFKPNNPVTHAEFTIPGWAKVRSKRFANSALSMVAAETVCGKRNGKPRRSSGGAAKNV
ncbi:S-layer homology domain-containing protein [Paenibacillus sp. J2TS4]|uniref:S-layer homology domain-containing protein n=1 Tax=Paenibacillus sp. J2TS4 TaxID=2807194 RepID=UPI0035B5603C